MNALHLEQVIAVQREIRLLALRSAGYCRGTAPHSATAFVRRARECTRTIIAAKRRLRSTDYHAPKGNAQ